MRIEVRLPKIEPETYDVPKQCPYEKCDGKHHKPYGLKREEKAIRDLRHRGVYSYRTAILILVIHDGMSPHFCSRNARF